MKIKKKSNAVRVPPLKKAIKVKRKSLDAAESTVSKALENVKKVLETKNENTSKTVPSSKPAKTVYKVNKKKAETVPRSPHSRGIVYLGHIPHGFYEEQMQDFFKQFGRVIRVRVARSKNTGKSRGYGYVKFLHPEVAKIAAETMNNYLMCGRLLKATYIPPERQHARFFAGRTWTKDSYPKLLNRKKVTEIRNAKTKQKEHARFIQSSKDKLSALEKKLKDKGYNLQFTSVAVTKV